jgi:UDP-N-acetylglucosamine diphosphorylase / glucose-1-phosphate thymidylyltransferase / UDP-N-acetylgalactosamine diphosphorylase / glucosamine-1-phosphate N-acetyltransferase / galactosamine-1-phosphate N-acetyltransferase
MDVSSFEIVVFEDAQVSRLDPVATARPAYAITCGSYRLVDWLSQLGARIICGIVRPHLRQIQRLDFGALCGEEPSDASARLYVNARLIASRKNFETLRDWIKTNRYGAVIEGDELIAAWLPAGKASPFGADFSAAAATSLPRLELALKAVRYPHDVVRANMESIRENLEQRIASGAYQQLQDGVFVAEGAKLGMHVVTQSADGPIVLDEKASIGPFCLLRGPLYIGKGTRVIEHAAIKDAVSIGHTCKIGGEVEAAVMEPYSNKQHHGFLGHSYLGSWINLGAGTCNSDLKNTYGVVNMDYRSGKVATGMQFVGMMMGDYAKSAINTGIFTGKTVGVCSMLYGFVTSNVPSFVNYARLFGQVTELPPEVMIATQQRMFARRNVTQRPCDIQLIHDLYELTREERQMASEPMAL